jgi:hypothetical protein
MGGQPWAAGFVSFAVCFGATVAEAQPTGPIPYLPEVDSPAPAPAPDPHAPVTPPPPAKPAPPFGAPGQIAVLGGSDIGVSSSSFDGSAAKYDNYNFSPEVDSFIVRNVSLGLAVDVSYTNDQGYGADGSLVATATTSVQVGPRIGVNLPIGRSVSFFPQLTIGYESIHTSESLVSGQSLSIVSNGIGSPSTDQSGPYIAIYAPLLFHPVSHFLLGFGPEFFHDFGGVAGPANVGGQRTTFGAGFVAGAYWGGKTDEAPTSQSLAEPPDTSRFGDQGQVVLSNNLVASISSLSRAGTSSSTLSGGVGGSVDYFVASYLSMGAALSVSGSNQKGTDAASGAPVEYDQTAWMLWFRLGFDVPIVRWLSFYPVGELGFGASADNETENGAQNQESEAILAVALYAPLLVHPAPHAFVGFGPGIYQDLSRAVTYPTAPDAPGVQNRETTLSLSLIVGGWL